MCGPSQAEMDMAYERALRDFLRSVGIDPGTAGSGGRDVSSGPRGSKNDTGRLSGPVR